MASRAPAPARPRIAVAPLWPLVSSVAATSTPSRCAQLAIIAANARAGRRGDWTRVAAAIDEEWENRKCLAPGVTTSAIDDLIARARAAGARAAKVCGAGGGGCLFCFADPGRTGAVREALASGGARLLDYRIESEGLRRG